MREAARLIVEMADTLDRLTGAGLEVTAVEAIPLHAAGDYLASAGALCESAAALIGERIARQGRLT
jgi:hypothetical protein